MQKENEKIICVDCNQEFELTEGWKRLMEQNPDIQKPKRCYTCRQQRKAGKEKIDTNRRPQRW